MFVHFSNFLPSFFIAHSKLHQDPVLVWLPSKQYGTFLFESFTEMVLEISLCPPSSFMHCGFYFAVVMHVTFYCIRIFIKKCLSYRNFNERISLRWTIASFSLPLILLFTHSYYFFFLFHCVCVCKRLCACTFANKSSFRIHCQTLFSIEFQHQKRFWKGSSALKKKLVFGET